VDRFPASWVKFTSAPTPKHLQLHLIVDNYATHKYPKVKAWLEKHKRFHMHFTPTISSWMNMVERFFRDITVYLRDGSFSSVRELETSMTTFLATAQCATDSVCLERQRRRDPEQNSTRPCGNGLTGSWVNYFENSTLVIHIPFARLARSFFYIPLRQKAALASQTISSHSPSVTPPRNLSLSAAENARS